METKRRSFIRKMASSAVALFGVGMLSKVNAAPVENASGKVAGDVTEFDNQPLFSGFTKRGDIVYLAGIGAHVAPFEIKAHTKIVLDQMEKKLKEAGSSMDKVLKVSVFLNDIADYKAMNEAYAGRFGKNPPVRTTVAVAKGGVPGDSLVEMDCIAYV